METGFAAIRGRGDLMLRYVRLYLYFIRFSFSRAMEFRLDFFFRIFMDLAYCGLNIAFFQVLFLHTPVLAGWSFDQVLIFVAGFLVIDAINMTVFSNNLWWLPVLVNKGDLDYYLIRPVSSFFFLSLRDFAANSFLNLVFALGILAWALSRSPDPLSWEKVLLYLCLLPLGAVLYFLLHMLVVLPVFWLQSGKSLHQLFYNLAKFMERPDRIYFGWARRVLVTLLPFALIASYPARMLLETFEWEVLLHFLGAIAIFFLVVLGVWRLGLRAYSSASS